MVANPSVELSADEIEVLWHRGTLALADALSVLAAQP
jgi:hypothetical protein